MRQEIRSGERPRARSLSRYRLFEGASRNDLDRCRRLFELAVYPPRSSIYSPGDQSGNVFLVERGRIRHSRRTPTGKEITLAIVRPGEVFGEEALFNDRPRATLARCLEETTVARARASDLRAFLSKSPRVAISLARVLSNRLVDMTLAIESFAAMSVSDRLMFHLERLANDYGFPSGSGVELHVPMTHAELALLIGTSRETVSIQIARLKRLGRLYGDGRRLILPATELPAL